MKKAACSLAVILTIALAFGGCSSSPSPAQATPDEGTPSSSNNQPRTSNGEDNGDNTVYNLKMAYYAAESIPPGQATQQACNRATELSDGRLQFDVYYSGTYVSKSDTMGALASGLIDFALVEAGQIAEVTVLNQIFNLLLAEAPGDRYSQTDAYNELISARPEFNDELNKIGINWVTTMALGGYNLHTTGKTVDTIDDINGMKIESHGDMASYVTSLGGSGVPLDAGDYYQSMERNMVEAQFTHWGVLNNFKICELTKAHTVFGEDEYSGGLSMPAMGFMANLKSWNGLPQDLKDIITETFSDAVIWCIEADEAGFEVSIQYARDHGDTLIYIKGEDRQPWVEAMQPIIDAWMEKVNSAGYPAQELYDAFLETIIRHRTA